MQVRAGGRVLLRLIWWVCRTTMPKESGIARSREPALRTGQGQVPWNGYGCRRARYVLIINPKANQKLAVRE
jgi:hypothetical protein